MRFKGMKPKRPGRVLNELNYPGAAGVGMNRFRLQSDETLLSRLSVEWVVY